ncbi:MAG: hypothetical protein AB8F74_21150 [Saprospiraceae bacterium]
MKKHTSLFKLSCLALCFLFSVQSAFSQSYTGEELFAGIYFSEGPVVEQIATLKKYSYKNDISNPDIRKSNQAFQKEVAAIVSKSNPDFFTNLEKEIASGNVNRIQAVLESSSKPVYDAMLQVMYSKTDIDRLTSQDKELNYLQEFIQSYTGGIYQSQGNDVMDEQALIALAAVWVAVVAWEYFWVSDEFIIDERVNMEGQLKKEQLVMDLSRL